MYSYKERKKAVELYIQYGYRAAAVVRHWGIPTGIRSNAGPKSLKRIKNCIRDIVAWKNTPRIKSRPQ